MKKIALTLSLSTALVFSIGSLVFTGCENSQKQSHGHEHADGTEDHDHVEDDAITVLYECPMHCEGDKQYEEAGTCSECGMDLKRVGNEDEHDHSGHGHDHNHDHGHNH